MAKTNYVLGFMFDRKQYGVLLIEKQKPAWQKGKLNGIGGKIEAGESAEVAMIREFKEETGIVCKEWEYVVTMYGEDWTVHVYYTFTNDVHDFKQTEDEEPFYIPLEDLDKFDVISNLHWLIPMCLDRNDGKGGIDYNISRLAK